MSTDNNTMQKIVSLCKRRGFVFQSSEIYGGLKSCYDYGPLGAELRRNIADAWWKSMVHSRKNIVGIDASIMMHPKVWETSGHLSSGFSDPLVDCLNCQERFRADKAPQLKPGTVVTYKDNSKKGKSELTAEVTQCGYVCPNCNCPKLSDEREFNQMFKTTYGPVDPINDLIKELAGKTYSAEEIKEKLIAATKPSDVYLRPETAQAIFTQFLNVQQSQSMKVPFGIAQIGKSFRNEIITEHFIFRSCEFEQMEMEFFCEPGTQRKWHDYWVKERLDWYKKYANYGDRFRAREHEETELAHYSDRTLDIEYMYPWGFDEVEGISSRTDFDLSRHSEATGTKLSYFEQNKDDPKTGKKGWRYTPYVIEPAAGLTRNVLLFLVDAYAEVESVDANGNTKTRNILKLHPHLAPYKVAILPLVKKDGQPELAQDVWQKFVDIGVRCSYDDKQSIGKRYAKHDEIGTPFCITIDKNSIENGTVTIRTRDTAEQKEVSIADSLNIVMEALK